MLVHPRIRCLRECAPRVFRRPGANSEAPQHSMDPRVAPQKTVRFGARDNVLAWGPLNRKRTHKSRRAVNTRFTGEIRWE